MDRMLTKFLQLGYPIPDSWVAGDKKVTQMLDMLRRLNEGCELQAAKLVKDGKTHKAGMQFKDLASTYDLAFDVSGNADFSLRAISALQKAISLIDLEENPTEWAWARNSLARRLFDAKDDLPESDIDSADFKHCERLLQESLIVFNPVYNVEAWVSIIGTLADLKLKMSEPSEAMRYLKLLTQLRGPERSRVLALAWLKIAEIRFDQLDDSTAELQGVESDVIEAIKAAENALPETSAEGGINISAMIGVAGFRCRLFLYDLNEDHLKISETLVDQAIRAMEAKPRRDLMAIALSTKASLLAMQAHTQRNYLLLEEAEEHLSSALNLLEGSQLWSSVTAVRTTLSQVFLLQSEFAGGSPDRIAAALKVASAREGYLQPTAHKFDIHHFTASLRSKFQELRRSIFLGYNFPSELQPEGIDPSLTLSRSIAREFLQALNSARRMHSEGKTEKSLALYDSARQILASWIEGRSEDRTSTFTLLLEIDLIQIDLEINFHKRLPSAFVEHRVRLEQIYSAFYDKKLFGYCVRALSKMIDALRYEMGTCAISQIDKCVETFQRIYSLIDRMNDVDIYVSQKSLELELRRQDIKFFHPNSYHQYGYDFVKQTDEFFSYALTLLANSPSPSVRNYLSEQIYGLGDDASWLLLRTGAYDQALSFQDRGRAIRTAAILNDQRHAEAGSQKRQEAWQDWETSAREFEDEVRNEIKNTVQLESSNNIDQFRFESSYSSETLKLKLRTFQSTASKSSPQTLPPISFLQRELPEDAVACILTLSAFGCIATLVFSSSHFDIDPISVDIPQINRDIIQEWVVGKRGWTPSYLRFKSALHEASTASDAEAAGRNWEAVVDEMGDKLGEYLMPAIINTIDSVFDNTGRSVQEIMLFGPGLISALPIQAAVMSKSDPNRSYLIDRFSTSFWPSIYSLRLYQNEISGRGTLTVIEDKHNGLETKSGFFKSSTKIDAIDGASLRSDTDLSNIIEKADQLYVLAHAEWHESSPYESRVFFGDRSLKVARLQNSFLRSGGYCFLASCETALGGQRILRDEYISPQAAFMECGYNAVVSAQWVTDRHVADEIASRFFAALETPNPRASIALRSAIQAFRSNSKAKGEPCHPASWAPYVCFGD